MIDPREPQRALFFRWDLKPFYPALESELGFSRPVAAVAVALVTANGEVSYSRRWQHYSKARRYKHPLFTFRHVVSAFDQLDRRGLIDHAKVPPGNRGWQSSAAARQELIEIVTAILRNEPRLVIATPRETVILRNESHDNIDYSDTQSIDRTRRRIERINEAIASIVVSDNAAAPLVRIYNQNFNRGGRFYAMGGAWQSMKKEARKALTINGERVAELDYKTLHPALLYAEVGRPLPVDAYDIPPWPRPLVKVALLIVINADNKPEARAAIAFDEVITLAGHERGSQDAFQAAEAIIGAIKRAHRPIARFFHSDAGARLMAIDSAIAETVQLLMLKRGIVVLPVHDSFLVPASKAAELEEAMMQAAYEVARLVTKIEVA